MSELLRELLSTTSVQEILVRTICVLAVSEGARIAYRSIMYQKSKMTRDKVRKSSETFGIISTIVIAVWMSWFYSTSKTIQLTVSEGTFYGFGTIFVHWVLMKYMDRKLKEKP
ncbi:MAG: hypothetical protein KJ899_15430 [Gammaproteobacteria bacterium]|nr:hypothetical protein [Gammaproteobacteria bacterium]